MSRLHTVNTGIYSSYGIGAEIEVTYTILITTLLIDVEYTMIDDTANEPLKNLLDDINYKEYLETIFPNSLIKNILYHGTYSKFEKFNTEFLTEGCKYFCFTNDIEYARQFGEIKYVKLNIVNPAKIKTRVGKSNINSLAESYIKDGFDSIMSKDVYYDGITMTKGGKVVYIKQQHGITIVPFNINQIYVLGTNEDKANFKNYLKSKFLL